MLAPITDGFSAARNMLAAPTRLRGIDPGEPLIGEIGSQSYGLIPPRQRDRIEAGSI